MGDIMLINILISDKNALEGNSSHKCIFLSLAYHNIMTKRWQSTN